jgi:purine-binding chemotaxis protein CheW
VSDRTPPRDGGAIAAELRAAFDATFARPLPSAGDAPVALLAIRVGGEPAALRVLETAGLMPARRIVPVPSRRPELLGVSGIRGAVVPIYGLARLLGRGDDGEPRWVVLASAGPEERIGLAVATFERHLVVPGDRLRPAAAPGVHAHATELVHAEGAPRPVLSIPSLVRAITGR